MLDAPSHQGFANGAFEDSEEEIADTVDEFFPAVDGSSDGGRGSFETVITNSNASSLKEKLDKKALRSARRQADRRQILAVALRHADRANRACHRPISLNRSDGLH